MTVNVNFSTVATAIAGLTVSGVTIKGVDGIAENAALLTPLLQPKPDGYISNISVSIDSFGILGAERMTINYNLTYRYLHAPIEGGLGGVFSVYSSLITNIAAILAAMITNDVINGSVDFRTSAITNIGPISDPSGNMYHGCDFVFKVQQFAEN